MLADRQIAQLSTSQATEIERLTGINARAKLDFTRQLAEKDANYARERTILIETAETLLETDEGKQALALFNAGGKDNWQKAKHVLAQIEQTRQQNRRFAAATDKRATAQLYLQARDRGDETTAAVITQFEILTTLDPDTHWDWIELARLYKVANQLENSLTASETALRTAKTERGRSVAFNTIGDILVLQNELTKAMARFEEGLVIARKLAAQDASSALAQRDLSVSLWKMAGMKSPEHNWQLVVVQLEYMQQRGMILPADEHLLGIAKQRADEEARR